MDEHESLNNKTDIYRVKPAEYHMFENRKWFVKEKLEPDEVEAARLYQQEALRDQLEALRGPAGRVQKKENLIPIRIDPDDPSSFQIDTEKLKKQKEEAASGEITQGTNSSPSDDLISGVVPGAPQLLPGRLASGRGEVGGYPENIQNHCHHCSCHLRTHKLPPPPGTRICLFLPNGGEFLGNRQITVS